jgi:hypothetical protein
MLDRRLGVPWSWSGYFGKKKNPLILMKIKLCIL